MRPVFTRSVDGHHGSKMVCWTSNTAVDMQFLFPVSCMGSHAEFDWASLEMAASFLEKPHKIAMEEKRWYQPETRENIREPKWPADSNGENKREEKKHDDRDGDEDTLCKCNGFLSVLMLEVRHRQYEHGCQWQGDQEPGGSRKSARQPSRDTNDQCGKDNIDNNRYVNTPCESSKLGNEVRLF
jgi:hypothetical protein